MHGSMSGVGKRSQLATAPNLDSTELFEKCLNYSISIHYPVLLKKQSVFSSPWIALKQRMFETWRIIRAKTVGKVRLNLPFFIRLESMLPAGRMDFG